MMGEIWIYIGLSVNLGSRVLFALMASGSLK